MNGIILALIAMLVMTLLGIWVHCYGDTLYCDPTTIKNDYYEVEIDNNVYYPKPKHLVSSDMYRLQFDLKDVPFDNDSIIKARGFKNTFYTKWIYLTKPEELEGLRVK